MPSLSLTRAAALAVCAGLCLSASASTTSASTTLTLRVQVREVCDLVDWSPRALVLRCTQGFRPAVPMNLAPRAGMAWAASPWVLQESRDTDNGTLNFYRRADGPVPAQLLVEFY